MSLAKNSMEGKAENYLRRIENLHDDLDSRKGEYMAACKEIRSDIREIFVEAKDNGVPVKALKGVVRFRQLEKKQREIDAGFDIDEASGYGTLVEALGELGMAAAKRAGYAPADPVADDDRDFRPTNLRNTDPDDLNKVGRGPQPQS